MFRLERVLSRGSFLLALWSATTSEESNREINRKGLGRIPAKKKIRGKSKSFLVCLFTRLTLYLFMGQSKFYSYHGINTGFSPVDVPANYRQ